MSEALLLQQYMLTKSCPSDMYNLLQLPRAQQLCTGCSSAKVEEAVALLRRKDAMAFTTVVAAPEDASLGERYATIATAAALGERVRDQGGHALVVIDDLACMVSPSMQTATYTGEWE